MVHIILGILAAFTIVHQFCYAENAALGNALMPAGTIPKGATFTLQQANLDSPFYDLAARANSGNELFQQVSADALYKVQTLQANLAAAEMADLQNLISRQQLMIQQVGSFNNGILNCAPAGVVMNCTAMNNMPVFKTGTFSFADQYADIMGLSNSPRSSSSSESQARYRALDERIFEVNKQIAGNKSLTKCQDKLPIELNSNPTLNCGVQQALKAFAKAKSQGEIKNNIFIFNDFSSGRVSGKMWFLNSDGSLANVFTKNPIVVASGEGGFGHGKGSLKTPDGAIKTLPYKYPRSGNIKDGIELKGLEEQNRDIHERGILIHGWDPHTATLGCLGIPGSYESNSAGKRSYGGTPQYYDALKKGLLNEGGVLIYNFTPNKRTACN